MVVSSRTIGSRQELLAVAEAMERDSAVRYRELAARLRSQGESIVAAEFEALAEIEDRHVHDVKERASAVFGSPGTAGATLPPSIFDEDEARGAVVSPYRALAFAVRNEERAFAFYTYAAAEAADRDLRLLAEDLARDELDHASRLRRLRRRAFHREKPVSLEVPTSVERLRDLVRTWEQAAAIAHLQLANRLESAGETARADIFRRLAGEEDEAGRGAVTAAAPPALANTSEGLRLVEDCFDRLAWIGERAKDEKVLVEAQVWAGRMVARLALVGDALESGPARIE